MINPTSALTEFIYFISDTTSCLQPNNFRCKDSTCIFLNATCNKIRDCPDGSDEESCESKVCFLKLKNIN